jgi:hypothetical protein
MKYTLVGIAVSLLIFLGGCTANQKAIHKVDNLEGRGPVVISVDAKQRAIIANWRQYQGSGTRSNEQTRRFCSEPSPDVFSVVAQSLSVGGSFGQNASPASIEAALNAAFSSSENGATIARTQSTNLLRELMFRTCERYMNGAVDELEMSVQAARDQRLIVSILAIEQLTGAVTPRPVVIGSAASGTAGASGDAIVAFEDARKSLETAESGVVGAQKKYDEINGTEKICDSDPVLDANKEKCNQSKSALAKSKTDKANAAERYQAVSALARSGGIAVSTNNNSEASGGIIGVQPQSIKEVANAVTTIVTLNANTDEFLFFCIRNFSDTEFLKRLEDIEGGEEIQRTCVQYITAGIKSDAEQRFNVTLYQNEVSTLSSQKDRDFEVFWTKISTNGVVDATKIRSVLAGIGEAPVGRNRVTIERLTQADDRDEVQGLFELLTFGWQQKLAGK